VDDLVGGGSADAVRSGDLAETVPLPAIPKDRLAVKKQRGATVLNLR
jgi:hypothetical protein